MGRLGRKDSRQGSSRLSSESSLHLRLFQRSETSHQEAKGHPQAGILGRDKEAGIWAKSRVLGRRQITLRNGILWPEHSGQLVSPQ